MGCFISKKKKKKKEEKNAHTSSGYEAKIKGKQTN